MSVDPEFFERIVDALNGIYGGHAGHRAVHAKGTLCSATFTASPEAQRLTRAAHMQGQAVRAHVRFSNASGKPDARDGSSEGQGMAVKFYLPNASTTDIIAVTVPVFVVRTPEDFLELTLARQPDPETGRVDMDKIGAFLQAHPESTPAVEAAMLAEPPESYLRRVFHAIHAFRFVDADGGSQWIRYRWQPEEGEASITRDEAKQRGREYLHKDLEERLAKGPGAFRLLAQLALEEDPLDDPTAAWPDDRKSIELGRLEVTELAFDRERDTDVLVFDPTRVPDGIECSPDKILRARPHAYAESVYRRSGVRHTPNPIP